MAIKGLTNFPQKSEKKRKRQREKVNNFPNLNNFPSSAFYFLFDFLGNTTKI